MRGGGKTPAGRVCWGGSEGSVEGAGSPGPALLLGGGGVGRGVNPPSALRSVCFFLP